MINRAKKLSMNFLSNRTRISGRTPGWKWLLVKFSTEKQRKSLRECKPTENMLYNKWRKNKDRKRYCKWNVTSIKQKGKKY